ncbi:hypothetical protein ACP4OV_027049 [Aristida adscensionis]
MGRPPRMAVSCCAIALVLFAAFTPSTAKIEDYGAAKKEEGKKEAGGGGGATTTPGAPLSPAAEGYMKSMCGTTKYPKVCFDDLSPFGESLYTESLLKPGGPVLAVAATTILVAKLDSFLKELHGININEPGKYSLGSCIKVATDSTDEQREQLAKFKNLATDPKMGETQLVTELNKWVSKVCAGYDGDCAKEIGKLPNVKEKLPSQEGVKNFLVISKDLLKPKDLPKDVAKAAAPAAGGYA